MTNTTDRSVRGNTITNSQVITGDHNTANLTITTLPPAAQVNLGDELAALRRLLATLQVPEAAKLDRALQDAEDEAKKPAPDRDEIGDALTRVVKYAKGANDFSDQVTKLQGPVTALVGWLGTNWTSILTAVRLAL